MSDTSTRSGKQEPNVDTSRSRLEVDCISKSFKSRTVVHSVSLHVKTGEIIGLLGPNGAGKTTSFNIIAGLESCDSGAIRLDGRDISGLPIYSRAKLGIGYLPQESSIFRRLNVEDNIKAILQTIRNLTPSMRDQNLEELLQVFGLEKLRKNLSIQLSGGERRRVEIARAFALRPRFLLLDEPLAGVDPLATEDIIGLIEFVCRKNVGILITDHNVRETLKVCTRAHILNRGKVIVSGNGHEIANHPDARKFYLGERFQIE